jgi:hypothetical protein
LITHASRSRWAQVSSAIESEPCAGSVKANAPSVPSAAVFGLFNIVYGITAVVLAAQARRVASTARTVAGTTAA